VRATPMFDDGNLAVGIATWLTCLGDTGRTE
jgi:hypothetical protein